MSSSSVIRVFRGCRALLASKTASSAAAAKPKTKPKAPTKPKPPSKAKKADAAVKEKTKRPVSAEAKAARTAAISKTIPVSPVFGSFLGVPEVSRPGALKKIWEYVKTNNLQNPANKREIVCDEKLKTIFDGKEKVGMLEIPKLLSSHFVKAS